MVYKTYPEEYEIGQKTVVTDEEIEEASNYIKQMREQYGRGSEEHRRAFRLSKRLRERQMLLAKEAGDPMFK